MSQEELREIVDVQITRDTAQLTRVGFGTLLAVANNFQTTASGTDIVKAYASLAEVIADGFTSEMELYKVAAMYFSQALRPQRLLLGQCDEATTIADLTAIQAVNDDWYALYVADDMDSGYQDRMLDIAEWIQPQRKIFAAKTREADTIGTTLGSDTATLAYDLRIAGYDRTFLLWAGSNTPAAVQGWQAAWFGRMLPTDPGSATWKFKNLVGVTPSVLTATQRDNARDKNVNIYTTVAGTNITSEGTMITGEYIDVIHGLDWLTQRLTEEVYRLLVNQPKVAFTDPGIAQIENVVRGQLRIAQDVGVIAPDTLDTDNVTVIPGFTITVPRVADTELADRADRILRGVTFEARLAGAIHKVVIRGHVAP